MFLQAGAVSLVLLLASRVLGLLRESALAAAFGATALGDLAVVMLTLPDWASGVLAGGAMAYVLIPHWAGQSPAQVAVTQRRVAMGLLALGVAAGAALLAARPWVLDWLVPALPAALDEQGRQALLWSALALPAAVLAALGVTRLQHERDFLGMYAANLVFTACLLAALLVVWAGGLGPGSLAVLGAALLGAAAARLGWLWLRHRRLPPAQGDAAPLPGPSLWAWAALAAGLPLTLPFVARSLVSASGEGALASFSYAWKLAELPLVLAVQLVASIAFPAVARAMARPGGDAGPAIRGAFVLVWAVACACAAGLLVGSHAVASLLFGWGRMEAADVERIAQWGSIAAWSLPSQALGTVALMILASRKALAPAVAGYGLALLAVVAAALVGRHDGASMMVALNLGLAAAAAVVLAALGVARLRGLPWREMAASLAALLGVWLAIMAYGAWPPGMVAGLAGAALAAALVLAAGWLAGPAMRQALRRGTL